VKNYSWKVFQQKYKSFETEADSNLHQHNYNSQHISTTHVPHTFSLYSQFAGSTKAQVISTLPNMCIKGQPGGKLSITV